MKKDQYIYLSRKAMLAAIISTVFPMSVNAAAGKVEFAYGGAAVQGADGGSKVLAKGMDINSGDTILTGRGRAQIKFTDGSYMSFQPDTQFKVEDYNFNGKQDGTEKGFFKLIEGGLRAITGLVGRENRSTYRLSTPVATIGIRGTEFLAEFREKLKTHVGQGSIFVFNDQGDLVLFAGQSAEVGAGTAPQYSDEQLTLGARGPDGSTPQEVKTEEQTETAFNDVFQRPEEYDKDGLSNSLGNLPNPDVSISAVIANLNGINAQGIYTLDTRVANVGGGAGYKSEVSSYTYLVANFGNYTMSGNFDIKSTDTSSSPTTYYDTFDVAGSILPSGSFGLTGTDDNDENWLYDPYYSSLCDGDCAINVTGLFSGTKAEKADVGYVVKQNDAIFLSGTAGIIANPPPAPLGQDGGISAVMANLNGINAEGVYILDPSAINAGGGSGYTSQVDFAQLVANFGSYTMYGDFNIASTSSSSPVYNNFSVSGSILPSGSFGLTGSNTPYSGVCGVNNCTLNVTGLFSGTKAQKADVGYVIKEGSTIFVSGTAGLVADPAPTRKQYNYMY